VLKNVITMNIKEQTLFCNLNGWLFCSYSRAGIQLSIIGDLCICKDKLFLTGKKVINYCVCAGESLGTRLAVVCYIFVVDRVLILSLVTIHKFSYMHEITTCA